MARSNVVLPTPFDPISPVNSPCMDLEGDVVEDLCDRRRTTLDVVDLEDGADTHSFSVDLPSVTAASIALTSAIIHDW